MFQSLAGFSELGSKRSSLNIDYATHSQQNYAQVIPPEAISLFKKLHIGWHE